MALNLWSSSFDQVSYDGNYSESLEGHYDYFRFGRDEIEEHALNVESCVQVLRILNTKADIEIEKLENDLLCLENDLACTEHENWSEICCSDLTKRIDQLDAAITTLKSDHTDDTALQLLLHSKPAETLHEIVKDLRKYRCQDSHGKHLDDKILNPIVNVTEHTPDNGIIREGGEDDFGTSENSQCSELLLELHEKRSDEPEKTEEFLAISLVKSPDAGVVSCIPYHFERMVLSDTLDEDVRQSQFATTDTCQILNPFSVKEENTPLRENVCSDDYRLANVEGMKMYSHSSFGTSHQEESENSDLAKKLHDFVPKTARRACSEESNVAPDEDFVPLQIVYPQKNCFADTESKIDFNFSKSNKHFPLKLKAQGKKKPEFEACSARESLNSPTSIIPSTSKNVGSTKRQRKPKTCTAGTILNEHINSKITWRAMLPDQDEVDGNAAVLYDSDYVSTKRQRKLKSRTAGLILIEPMNNKIDDNDIVLYEGGITNSDRFPMNYGSQYNGKALSLVDYHNESSETLMKERLVVLKSMAQKYKIKGYYKLNKADLVEELVKRFSSR